MIDSTWNVDLFSSELTAVLGNALAGARDTTALELAVTECAAAAEAVCCGRPMVCTAGCPHCCVLNVAILLPEGVVIADWLQKRLSSSELGALRERLALHRARTRWVDDEERITKHVTCPMLDTAGDCTIHPVRPMVCRAVTSLDRNSCLEAFSPVITDEARLVLADLLRQAVFDAAFTTLAKALRFYGLDDRSIDLGGGVMAFLEGPEYREQLLSGGRLPSALWL